VGIPYMIAEAGVGPGAPAGGPPVPFLSMEPADVEAVAGPPRRDPGPWVGGGFSDLLPRAAIHLPPETPPSFPPVPTPTLPAHHERLVRDALAPGDVGCLVASFEGSAMLVFTDPAAAAACAARIERAIRRHNERRPDAERLWVRAGLATGEAAALEWSEA